jgi:hypothetical protein
MMGDKILNIIWGGFVVWACLAPGGYAPYVLLGFNCGDFLLVLYCGFTDGYLKEPGDLDPRRFIIIALTFVLLAVFYAGQLSFKPGSDAYNNAVYFIFISFWFTFGYRFLQYRVINMFKRDM